MFVRMKHRYASSGLQTIGSPRTLNEVLMMTGQPYFSSKCLDHLVKERIDLPVHGLDPRRVVHVRDRRNVERTTCSFSMPKRACSSSVISRRSPAFTGATSSM